MSKFTDNSLILGPVAHLGLGEVRFSKRRERKISSSSRFRKLPLALITCLLGAFTMAVMAPQIPLVQQFATLKWVILIGFTLITSILSGLSSRSLRGILPKLFGMFIIVATTSTLIFSIDLGKGLQRILSFILLWTIAFAAPYPSDPVIRLRHWTLASFLIATAVTILSVPSALSGSGYYLGRLTGVTSNANDLGTFSMMFTVGTFSLMVSQRKIIYCLLFPLGFSVLFLTGSRSSFIATIGAFFALLALSGDKKLLRGAVLIFMLGLISIQAVSYVISPAGSQNLLNRGRDFRTREAVWDRQIDSFLSSPIIGSGLEIQESVEKGLPARVGGEGSYMDILSEGGILGGTPLIIALLWGPLSMFKNLRKMTAISKRYQRITWEMCAFGLVVGILINSIGEGYMAAVGAMEPIYVWVALGTVNSMTDITGNKL